MKLELRNWKNPASGWYKALNENGSCCNGEKETWYLPSLWRPGKWMPKVPGKLALYKRGYHVLKLDQLVFWLGPAIFETEISGPVLECATENVVNRARLIRKFHGWNETAARLFACDCAEHALNWFKGRCLRDERVLNALRLSRAFAKDRNKTNANELRRAENAASAVAESTSWIAYQAVIEAACYASSADVFSEATERYLPMRAARAAAWGIAAAAGEAACAAEQKWQAKALARYLYLGA